MTTRASITLKDDTLSLAGDWTIRGIEKLSRNPLASIILPTYPLTLSGLEVSGLDSAGVYLIEKIKKLLTQAGIEVEEKEFNEQQKTLIELVLYSKKKAGKSIPIQRPGFFARVGEYIMHKVEEFLLWMTFVGEFAILSLKMLKRPACIPWKSIIATIDFTGFRALPIIGLLSFLIGIVLAYQVGVELEYYGANMYIVNFLGIAILREFGPLLAAIILAARTSSAYTAHIGLMKANEEIDALRTMGLSPTELLIFPRIVGLIIVMPLLTVWSDICGVLGGMLMAKASLGVSIYTFITQFPQVITLPTFIIGLVKAPAFAMIVASVGCFHGLRVTGSATSIGLHTTKSVVLAIFLIIIADALFSVILSYFGF